MNIPNEVICFGYESDVSDLTEEYYSDEDVFDEYDLGKDDFEEDDFEKYLSKIFIEKSYKKLLKIIDSRSMGSIIYFFLKDGLPTSRSSVLYLLMIFFGDNLSSLLIDEVFTDKDYLKELLITDVEEGLKENLKVIYGFTIDLSYSVEEIIKSFCKTVQNRDYKPVNRR